MIFLSILENIKVIGIMLYYHKKIIKIKINFKDYK